MISLRIIFLLGLCLMESKLSIRANPESEPFIRDCLIHKVTGESTTLQNPQIKSHAFLPSFFGTSTTLSYTTHQISDFNFAPGPNQTDYLNEDFNPEENEVDSLSGFFRFTFKLSSFCVTVLIETLKFNETLIAIQKSGYGTSEQTLFLIEAFPLNKHNEVINGFANDLFNSDGIPFHAPIVFVNQNLQEISMFCYFCPMSLGRIQPVIIDNITNIWNHLVNQHSLLNSNGYGHLVVVPVSIVYAVSQKQISTCLNNYSRKRIRTNHFGEHVNCTVSEFWLIASTQSQLNISLTFDASKKIDGNNYQKWMLQLRYGEGLAQLVPNVYTYTRGSLIIVEQMKLDLMACLDGEDLKVLDFSIISALDLISWSIGRQVISINRNILCKVDQAAEGFALPYGYTVRIWRNLGKRFSQVIETILSSGDYIRLRRLEAGLASIQLGKSNIEKAGHFIKPNPIGLKSAIGVGCGLSFSVGCLLLIWWCIGMSKIWRKKIKSQMVFLRQEIHMRIHGPAVNFRINVNAIS
ncbi:unnamed protein product [Orchesella dallaii]|uniref:Glycoprotein n=1 Tax=Orchesella dallaii TaxID=48710 RepID=A0ABP1PI13_9HEXA